MLQSALMVIVEMVERFKILGVNISNDLSWTKHSDMTAKKAYQHFYFLRRQRKFSMPPMTLQRFTDAS